MIIGKSKKEMEKMRAAGQLTGLVLQELRNLVEPGITHARSRSRRREDD